jgi:hypothetical protein
VPRKRKVTSLTTTASGIDAGKPKLLCITDLDGRTIAAKRAKALCTAMEDDLGGADTLSTIQAR